MSLPWEEIHVPSGSYIGWSHYPGQYAMGVVISYGPTDGTTQKGEPCPETVLELIEPAASFDKQGNRTDYQAGAIVQITHSQVSSKKAALAADAKPGDLVKYTLTDYLVGQGKEGGDVKVFGVNIVRNYRPRPAPQQQAAPQFGGVPAQQQPNFGGPQLQPPPQQQQFGQQPIQQQPQQFVQNSPPPQQAPPQFGNGHAQPVPAAAPSFGADDPPPF